MKLPFREVISGFVSLLTGMWITMLQCFKPSVTLHYPHKALKMPARYRGHIVFKPEPTTGDSTCVACDLCAKACPSDCIIVDGVKKPGDKRKSVTVFELDYTKCSLCGACVEVCPVDALEYSRSYNLASTTKSEYHLIDLVKKLESERKK